MLFIGYPKCSTSKKAEKWMKDNGYDYDFRDISVENPNLEELKNWHEASGLELKRFFNTSGKKYRELGLKDKLANMMDSKKYELLATDGMLVKRPILIDGDKVLVGFKLKEWEDHFEEKSK